MKILVVGVGYVGLVTGACFAEMGHHVTCLDIDEDKILSLQKGKIPIYEPRLEELVIRNQHQKRLHFTTDYKIGLKDTLFCFLALGTPSLEDGSADTTQIKEVINTLAKQMDDYLVIINKSTVPVGTTRALSKQIQNILNSRKVEIPFDVISNPEFLKEGSAVEDCLKPDRIIIGSNSEKATHLIEELYSSFNLNHKRLIIMSFESAELTKYASNAMLATRISFMNELSNICEKVGADIKDMRIGIGLDKRIGLDCLWPGPGWGGSCFPKDLQALQKTAMHYECPTPILEATQTVNHNQKRVLSNKIALYFEKTGGLKGKVIAIWGLSYKPNTDDIRESPSLVLINDLQKKGATLKLYDPVAISNAKKVLSHIPKLSFCLSEYQAAKHADAVVLVTEWRQFRFVDLRKIFSLMKGSAFFDGRNQYNPLDMLQKGFHYFGIGIPSVSKSLLEKAKASCKDKTLSYGTY